MYTCWKILQRERGETKKNQIFAFVDGNVFLEKKNLQFFLEI